MWPAVLTGAVNALGGVLGFKSAQKTNQVNQAEAEKNRRFQERMRNTQWQAGVEDMRAAGLNPALAYSQGPASAPGGSMAAPAENPVSSALSAMQARKGLELLDAQVRKTKEETRGVSAEADLKRQRATYLLSTHDANGHRLPPLINDMIQMELDQMRAGIDSVRQTTARNYELTRMAAPVGELAERLGPMMPLLSFLFSPGGVGNAALRAGGKGGSRMLSRWLRSRR